MRDPVHNLSLRIIVLIDNIQCDNKSVPLFAKLQIHLCATDNATQS